MFKAYHIMTQHFAPDLSIGEIVDTALCSHDGLKEWLKERDIEPRYHYRSDVPTFDSNLKIESIHYHIFLVIDIQHADQFEKLWTFDSNHEKLSRKFREQNDLSNFRRAA